jgi:hypothetical protein
MVSTESLHVSLSAFLTLLLKYMYASDLCVRKLQRYIYHMRIMMNGQGIRQVRSSLSAFLKLVLVMDECVERHMICSCLQFILGVTRQILVTPEGSRQVGSVVLMPSLSTFLRVLSDCLRSEVLRNNMLV